VKVAINTRFLLANKLEGIGWFTFEVVKRMVEQHPEVEFIFFFDRKYDEQFIFGKNVTPIVLNPPARHPVLWYIWFEWAVARALKRHQPDVFLSPDNYLSLSTKVPTTMVVHDIAYAHFPMEVPYIFRKFYQHFVPKYIQKADNIVAVSEYTKHDILDKFNVSTHKIAVACNGCRDIFQPLEAAAQAEIRAQYAKEKDYFLYIGAVHPRKNVHRLIEAFDLFKAATQSDMQLLIVGRFGWQTGVVKTAYEQSPNKADIQFLGYVAEAEMAKILASCYAFIYPSLFEGFGIPILEAMHCEVPVITSNVSSMPEVAGDAGILIHPNDVDDICSAMLALFENKALRASLIEKGKTQRTQFSWQRAADVVWEQVTQLIR